MPIPGCEDYNAEYFSKKQMSIKCNSLLEIVDNTYKLLENKEMQDKIIENQKKYIDKNACKNICDFIVNQVKKIEGI